LLANLMRREKEEFASKLAPTGIGDPSGFATMVSIQPTSNAVRRDASAAEMVRLLPPEP
jgi:hypothetical protein